ncbi:Transcriptional regulator containing an AAA-type ATPase domain and a DNA-binding domain [Thermoanaerobacter thermohydrosulfuricus]|uniref:Transcriptional regulator containing an AAA-type ATPase domain and a DNA-binding domain n=2 Tax=Thermoanaerobacteraceae TaxID=186814 RepID=A0A1G7K3S6_THETY|nr:Transcriptional regulator containing an AAA-type ATPase domain and a DNA-binding domain [Thermoanaerobacter thermohydrosulfuricus]SFE16789.1 Transcriptional regulator containing an AAA-type ATPase domain and a DNA-binding domain [Thermoanaerobacter thermohydrosulfuricus]
MFYMTNKEKIYNIIVEKSKEFDIQNFLISRKGGITTEEVAQLLKMARPNVSFILNHLVREGKIVKIISKPVYYIEKNRLAYFLGNKVKEEMLLKDLIDFLNLRKEKECAFENIIGHDGSLKGQIEQAKAAVLYPPYGLHTLIIGPPGSGKSFFAEMMYKFSLQNGRVGPLEVLNCADYYNNPQLLMSHLFGHVKGAYTGADVDKIGLVEKADKGILFLDEVHRLPPEGQEMLFYLIDKGVYRRLGDTVERTANLMIVAATTEKPDSFLLKTFMRRIPVIIQLPSFEGRPLNEKIEIIVYLFKEEAKRLNLNIIVHPELISLLLSLQYEGNIGELKSIIQLLCSKAFLMNYETKRNFLKIDLTLLPSVYFNVGKSKTINFDKFLIISSEIEREIDKYDFYEFIAMKYNELKEKGIVEIFEIMLGDNFGKNGNHP